MTVYKYADADKLIAKVKSEGETQKKRIHNIAICFLSEWARVPDLGTEVAGKLTELQTASGYHAKHFADWMAVKSGMKYSDVTEAWYTQVDQKCSKERLDAAKAEPFWIVSPPTKPKPLTDEVILKLIDGVLARQVKHEKKAVDGDDFSLVANEALRNASKLLKAEIERKELLGKIADGATA